MLFHRKSLTLKLIWFGLQVVCDSFDLDSRYIYGFSTKWNNIHFAEKCLFFEKWFDSSFEHLLRLLHSFQIPKKLLFSFEIVYAKNPHGKELSKTGHAIWTKKKQLKTSFFSLDSLNISNVSDRMWEFPKLNTHEM